MNYLDELNDVQRQAVTQTDGPVLVVAGPGSGKTRVLTYRIAHLVEKGVAPHEILALTFTNKAAREMKERIERVVGERASKVWAGTFHAIFARILRTEAQKIGYPAAFTIYDTEDAQSLMLRIVKEKNLDPKVYVPNAILSRISSAKANLITPKAYEVNEELRSQDRTNGRPHLQALYAEYLTRCKKAGAMDFDDLLYQMFYLLHANPDGVLEKYRQRFRYVLVDEFQDTNYLQYAIIRKLVSYPQSPRNICAVGDDAQSIYAFRGATIQNILDFEKDFLGMKIFKLEQNYRSTGNIVQAANTLISFNRRQIQKKIWSNKGEGEMIKVAALPSDNDEGRFVGDVIMEQKARYHLANREIAILYRTNSQSRLFEEALRRQNIPYRVYGGMSFYQRKEVKDLIAYLRAIVNPADEEALKRIINQPKRGIGNATLDKIAADAAAKGIAFWDAVQQFQTGKNDQLKNFVLLMETFRKRAEKDDAYQLATYVAKQSGLLAALKADNSVEGVNRMENFVSLLDSIKDFVENDELLDDAVIPDKRLGTYLQTVALHTDADADKGDADCVTLMSVHAAKGLEFKSVFVTGLEENLFPSFMAKDNPEGTDEERRLFYVAITRAEEFLTLSYAKTRYRYGEMRFCEASCFLREVGDENLDTRLAEPPKAGRTIPHTVPKRYEQGSSTSPSKVSEATDIQPFTPVDAKLIKVGCVIIHQRLGKGKVLSIEGSGNGSIAVIHFEHGGEKRIMLKFAKMGILEGG